MVFSPVVARPRAASPPIPASRAPASAWASSTSRPATAPPARRKKVPYRGPEAPPTVDTRVVPTFLSRASALAKLPACTASAAAARPRFMLVP